MADLPKDQQSTQTQAPTVPVGDSEKPEFPPKQEETPSSAEENLKTKLSSLGIKEPEKPPKRGKIILAVLALLFLVASIPAAVYLVQQRQEIRERAVYPTPTPRPTPTPTPRACEPVKTYSGATTPGYDCARGGSASVTVTACLPEGCPLNGASVSYSKTIARCPGENRANCEGACGAGATTTTLTIQAGQRCASATVSCGVPGNCGTCQVDIDGYGVRRWENSGCEAPPEYTAQCEFCRVYDTDWNLITDLSLLQVGQTVYLATQGFTTHPQGITKARFRINSGTWQETTSKHGNEFYIQYTIPSAGSYTVESMVYNPVLGWY